MLRFVPFEPAHVAAIVAAQPHLATIAPAAAWAPVLRDNGLAETALAEEAGRPRIAGCGGILHQWPGRAIAWALIGRTKPQEWTAIVRRMKTIIAGAEAGSVWRLEAQANADFAPGCRLLELLGFERECLARRYTPAGGDAFFYVRVH